MITQFFLSILGGLVNFLISLFPVMPATPDSFTDIQNFTNNLIGTSTGYLIMIYGAMFLPMLIAALALITVIPSWFIVVFIFNKIRGSGS